MRRFVVELRWRGVERRRYVGTDAANGSAAIAAARDQMNREGEPPATSYHAKPCPAGVVNPF